MDGATWAVHRILEGGNNEYSGWFVRAFRNEWQSSPYRDRYTWDQVAPAYQYGWEAASRPEYANRSWDQLRPELQRNWRYQGAWNDYEPMVRNAWERRQTSSRQTTGATTTRR